MPRYRKLYTKTLESLDINDMPDDFTRLFWTLLPLVLCREGRGINSPAWLKSKIFPLREDVDAERVGVALDWCIQRGMIVPYSVDGRDYFYVPSFPKYQGNTTKEAESDYPPPQSPVESKSGVSPEEVQSKSVTDANADADAVCNIQYSAATASGADSCESNSAVADVLQELFDLGVKGKKASSLITAYQERGELPELVPRMAANIAHYSRQDGVKNPVGLAITQTEARANPPRAPTKDGYWRELADEQDRRRYVEGKHADIIEH